MAIAFKIFRTNCCVGDRLAFPPQKLPTKCPVCKKPCNSEVVGYALRDADKHQFIDLVYNQNTNGNANV